MAIKSLICYFQHPDYIIMLLTRWFQIRPVIWPRTVVLARGRRPIRPYGLYDITRLITLQYSSYLRFDTTGRRNSGEFWRRSWEEICRSCSSREAQRLLLLHEIQNLDVWEDSKCSILFSKVLKFVKCLFSGLYSALLRGFLLLLLLFVFVLFFSPSLDLLVRENLTIIV